MAKIKRRIYKSKSKKIRVALDKLYELFGRIKHEYGLTDDDHNYSKMKSDALKIALETSELSNRVEKFIQVSNLRHY